MTGRRQTNARAAAQAATATVTMNDDRDAVATNRKQRREERAADQLREDARCYAVQEQRRELSP